MNNRLYIGDKAEGLSAALSIASEYLGVKNEELATHPDFLMLERKEKKGMGVDEANSVLEKAVLMPILSEKTVIIIHEIDSMNDIGQNILLKLLEDKNHYIMVLATASDGNLVLDTVKSRMTCVEYGKMPKAEFLKQHSQEPVMYWLTSGYAGRMPLAEDHKELFMRIKQALDSENRVTFFDTIGLLKEKDTVSVLQSGEVGIMFFNFLEGYYTDRMDKSIEQGDVWNTLHSIRMLEIIAEEKAKFSNLYTKNDLFCFVKRMWDSE